ncbi:putative PHD type zinc finger protein with BAH domain-containing protein [Entomophthora muscae]|uniref:PHD type zinc finger protein with BAH domain-containing protein n=1 Tax=Entomophthora muscae TaxID=34485 RepID=A0ACC2TS28_9FUNG|nr:putative PHD type zinc finger protein with BAH domain-containing protein [Entomophthora muscae]
MSTTVKNSTSAGYKVPSSVTLRDGSVVRVNDCVFLNSISQGDFYQIVRITQFLPSSKRDVKAEVAHFYRKCNTGVDWSAKDDPILLYATLSTEDIHTCHIVSKCTVTHLSFIHDMEKYRRLENHFYFSQFYEKVQGQIYDVTPTLHVQNLPSHFLDTLRAMFSYVFAEKSEVRRLKEPRRDCAVCKMWCENGNAIKCMLCEEYYHGQCTTPPVTTRLSKGFDFQCSRCLSKAKVDFTDPKQIYVSSMRSAKNSSISRKPNGVESDVVFTAIELKCTQNHPIRYLGKGIEIAQALDSFSSLHVRFSIPLGKEHQINPPPYIGPGVSTQPRAATPPTTLQFGRAYPASRLIITEAHTEPKRQEWLAQLGNLPPKEPEHEAACPDAHTIFRPEDLSQELKASLLWDRLFNESFSIPSHSLEFGARAYREMSLQGLEGDGVVAALKGLEPLDFGYFSHLAPETNFETALMKHGFDFDQIAKEFPPMNRGAAIQRFYAWKSEVVRQKERHGSTFSEKPSQLMAMVNPNDQEFQEEEPADTQASNRRQRRSVPQVIKVCSHCRSKDEPRWSQVPTFVTQKPELASIMCVTCANYLFRHAVPRPLLEPPPAAPKKTSSRSNPRAASDDLTDKASEESSKRPRSHKKQTKPRETVSRSSSVSSFTSASYCSSGGSPTSPTKRLHLAPPEGSPGPQSRPRKKFSASRTMSPTSDYGAIDPGNPSCRICGSAEGLAVCACSGCGLKVHPGCYPGLALPVPDKWSCDWCINIKGKTTSQNPRCVACDKVGSEFKNQMGSMCLKATAGNNWVHLVCFAFIDPLSIDTTGKITGIVEANCSPWNKPCDLCPQSSGLTIQCKLCPNSVHALCAQAADYQMGFKPSQEGEMTPWVICCNHSHEDLSDFHKLSELDATTNLTQIGKYLGLNKHKSKHDPECLPRKPFPLTTLTPLATSMCAPLQGWSREACSPMAATTCLECKSTTSPFWWNVFIDPHAPPSRVFETAAGPAQIEPAFYDFSHNLRMCHSCYWESKERQGAPVSPALSVSSVTST